MWQRIKDSWPVARVLGAIGTTVNATVQVAVHYSLLASLAVGAMAIAGNFINPLWANAGLAGLLAFAAMRVILWQASLATAPVGQNPLTLVSRVGLWLEPMAAMDAFCSQELIAARQEAISASQAADQKYDEAFEGIKNQSPGLAYAISSGVAVQGMEDTSSALVRAQQERAQTSDNYRKADAACIVDVMRQLAAGSLVAKGVKEPYSAGDPEVVIPAFEWRLMNLQYHTAKAVGKNIEYRGLVIGKVK